MHEAARRCSNEGSHSLERCIALSWNGLELLPAGQVFASIRQTRGAAICRSPSFTTQTQSRGRQDTQVGAWVATHFGGSRLKSSWIEADYYPSGLARLATLAPVKQCRRGSQRLPFHWVSASAVPRATLPPVTNSVWSGGCRATCSAHPFGLPPCRLRAGCRPSRALVARLQGSRQPGGGQRTHGASRCGRRRSRGGPGGTGHGRGAAEQCDYVRASVARSFGRGYTATAAGQEQHGTVQWAASSS